MRRKALNTPLADVWLDLLEENGIHHEPRQGALAEDPNKPTESRDKLSIGGKIKKILHLGEK